MGDTHIDNLRKEFADNENTIVAVDDLNLEISDGEFLVLVGPSGCGKSTTLRCVAGLEKPTSGAIRLNGENIVSKEPKKRDMAMVFQSYALYPHMTARDNMGFGLKMTTDLSKDRINEQVESTAEMMGIEDLLEKKPDELSGGQQQRVALGRAIVRDPEVFLMDEPLSNLDAKLRTQMRTELQELQQDFGATTIYVTHDQTEAMTMGDRIAVLNDGELQQVGTPLECYHEPANQFVAGFIGSPSMNFLDVEFDEGAAQFNHTEFEYALSDATVEALTDANASLTLGIRPEDVRLGDTDDRNTITVEIDVVEPLGDQTFLYFDLDGQTFTASISGEQYVNEGEVMHLVFPEDKIHIFDRATGEAIKNRKYTADADRSQFSMSTDDTSTTAD